MKFPTRYATPIDLFVRFLLIDSVLSFPITPDQALSQALCSAVNVLTYHVTYPILINQYFENNTIVNVGGITVNINNAPTSLSTIIQGTSTVTSTQIVAAATGSAIPASLVGGPFVLAGNILVSVLKRQEADRSFLTFGSGVGSLVQSCDEAIWLSVNTLGELLNSTNSWVYGPTDGNEGGMGQMKLGNGTNPMDASFTGNTVSWTRDGVPQKVCAESDGPLWFMDVDTPTPSGCQVITVTKVDPTTDIACLDGTKSSAASSTGSPNSSNSQATASNTGSSSAGAATSAINRNPVITTTTITSTTSSTASATPTIGPCDSLTGLLRTVCLEIGGNPCTLANIVKVTDPAEQKAVIALCPNNISAAVQECVNGTDAGAADTPLTTLPACLAGLGGDSSDIITACSALPVVLAAYCLATGEDPCTLAAVALADPNDQAEIIGLCPNNISPDVEACLIGFSPFTTLAACLTGVLKNPAGCPAYQDVDPGDQLYALCLADNDVDPCTAAPILQIDPSLQTELLAACGNHTTPAVNICLTDLPNVNACLQGVVNGGGDTTTYNSCKVFDIPSSPDDPSLERFCLTEAGEDPCLSSTIVKDTNSTSQITILNNCVYHGLASLGLSSCVLGIDLTDAEKLACLGTDV